jgi:hypothetical protein
MKNVLSYHGPMNINLVSFLANYMKDIVDADQAVIKRLFKVFIELTQNVSYYSALMNEIKAEQISRKGVGWFYIDEYEHDFTVATGNLIKKEHGPVLKKNCDEINNLEENELRELKRKTRSQAAIRDVGAHIGLIHTGLISGNPLDVEISPIDDNHSFFRISVKIDKIIHN